MIVDLSRYNGKPLTFPLEWKRDHLAVFFNTCVEKGWAVWEEKKPEIVTETGEPSVLEEACQEKPTQSSAV